MTKRLPAASLFSEAELPLRALSSAEHVDHSLVRAGAVDASGPELNSFIELNPDAMTIATDLDAELRDGKSRGPLHGLAIAVKDNIDTADAMLTTAGSLALASTKPTSDAALVTALRRAGLVLLGKANLSEWANIRSPHSTSGWSARGGLTRNPWDTTRNAGGSSSGSGAAVSAGLAPLAVGTETDGSIICPASYNGVVGLKPTVGLLPTDGIVPISHSQDSPGPMARSVRLTAALLDAMTGRDEYFTATSASGDVGDLTVGVVRNHFGHHAATDDVVEAAVAVLGKTGVKVIDPVSFPTLPTYDEPGTVEGGDEMAVLLYELKHDLNRYLAARPSGGPRTLDEVIAFNSEHAEQELLWFGQEYFEKAQMLGGLDSDSYQIARTRSLKAAREDGIDAVLREHGLDALISPAFPPAIVNDLVLGDANIGGDATTAPAIAGYPILSLPIGFVHGLPVGMAMTGTTGAEATLLRIAAALEAALGLLESGELVPPV
jgi:amidase